MQTPSPLRIPAWLAGFTIALMIAAAVRVAEVTGLAGLIEFAQLLTCSALCVGALWVAELYEAQLADIYWPGPKLRQLVFVALLVVLDFYLASIFFRGAVLLA